MVETRSRRGNGRRWARGVSQHVPVPSGLGLMWVGLAVMFLGFTAKWTDRAFGLAQVVQPELFEWIGTWAMRIGFVIAAAGGLVWALERATGV